MRMVVVSRIIQIGLKLFVPGLMNNGDIVVVGTNSGKQTQSVPAAFVSQNQTVFTF